VTDAGLDQQSDEEQRRRLGDRLREARKYLGLKQEEVANYLKIPRTALPDIESGQRRVEAIELTRHAKEAGADAALVVRALEGKEQQLHAGPHAVEEVVHALDVGLIDAASRVVHATRIQEEQPPRVLRRGAGLGRPLDRCL